MTEGLSRDTSASHGPVITLPSIGAPYDHTTWQGGNGNSRRPPNLWTGVPFEQHSQMFPPLDLSSTQYYPGTFVAHLSSMVLLLQKLNH